MSWDFTNITKGRSRKDRICEQCRKTIPAGEDHSKFAGKFEGEFMTYSEHLTCRDAWIAHANHIGREDDGDGMPFFSDDEDLDRDYLAAEWPDVAARMGIDPRDPTTNCGGEA